MNPLPKACPKCESKDGWEPPRYVDGVGEEWLVHVCRTCRYPLRLPCADAQA